MNFFSSEVFLEALAKACFAGRACRLEHYRLAGLVYRLLTVDGQPVLDWPFVDFFEPLSPETIVPSPVKSLSFMPRAAVALLPVTAHEPALSSGQQHAPLVNLRQFPSWEAFEAHVAQRRKSLMSDSARRERKLAAAMGPVSFSFHDPSEEAFERCREWKSAQYVATGGTDRFFRENLGLFHELLRREALVMSTLRSGGKLLAVNWSFLAEGRLSYWVPAHDPAHAAFSPGRLLLHRLLKEAHQRGLAELDLLIGDEDYKWHYATHSRVIASVGQTPWRQRLEKTVKTQLKKALARYPGILEAARRAKRSLRS